MSPESYPDALPPQCRLHWYVLERVLGQGGFGITYHARDTNLDQAVAIKEYLPVEVATRRADTTVRPRSDDQAERYRWGLDRFIQEARTLARFDHPNIVRVLSVFEHNGTAYMVMRFEEGENFAALLDRRRTLPEADLMRVLMPVLDGLELVHSANFIHRDIKPDNIHIRADGSPVLLDFGSARHAVGQARTVTILVAPGYAPFEQYYSSGEDQGPWTDIYSLGATCYRAIAGVPPMDAIARSKGILGSTREILVPAAAVGSGRYSERLLKAVDHALAFADKDRPRSIAAWRVELAGKTASQTRAAPAVATAQPAPAAARLPALLSVAAVAVIAAGAGAYLATGGRDPREDPPPQPKQVTQSVPAARPSSPSVPKPAVEAPPPAKPAEVVQVSVPPAAPAVTEKPDARVASTLPTAPSKPKPVRPVAPKPPAPPTDAALTPLNPKTEPVVTPPPPMSDAASFTHYRELARGGDAEAALHVGEMFESGRGVQPSNNYAYFWYVIAERRGASGATQKKEAAARRLQPMEIQQMDKQARGER